MPIVAEITDFLENFAPLALAADWDNVGLLVGDRSQEAQRIMTCLTITPESVAEALDESAGLIVTHHPLPFRPLRRLSADTTDGRMLWDLIRGGISIHSPHTAFDSAAAGINQQLAEHLGLGNVQALHPVDDALQVETGSPGAGRYGTLPQPTPLATLFDRIKKPLQLDALQYVGEVDQSISRVGIGCGSAAEFLDTAAQRGCDGFVTGEMRFHDCLHARALGIGVVLLGHYASERFAVEKLATVLAEHFHDCHVWPCRRESDPIRFA